MIRIELIELTVINILDTSGSRLHTAVVRTSIRTIVVYKKTCSLSQRPKCESDGRTSSIGLPYVSGMT